MFLPGESHGQRSLVGYSLWGRKESDTTERLQFSSVQFSSNLIIILWPMTHLELYLNLPVYEDVIFSLSYICFHCTEIKKHSLYNVSSLRCVETCTDFLGFKLWMQGNVCNKILTDIYCWLSVFQKLHSCWWTSSLGILRKCGAGFTTIRSSLTSMVHDTSLGNWLCVDEKAEEETLQSHGVSPLHPYVVLMLLSF